MNPGQDRCADCQRAAQTRLATDSEPRYRSLRGHRRVAALLLSALALSAIATCVAGVVQYQVQADWLSDTRSVQLVDVIDADERRALLGRAMLGTLALAGIAFVAWTYRAYSGLSRGPEGQARFHRAWVILGWIVPIWWLFRPKQIVNDLWRAGESDEGWTPSASLDPPRVSPAIHTWWAAVLSVWVLTLSAPDLPTDDVQQLQYYVQSTVVVSAVVALGALAALWIVIRVTGRLEARATRAGQDVDHPAMQDTPFAR